MRHLFTYFNERFLHTHTYSLENALKYKKYGFLYLFQPSSDMNLMESSAELKRRNKPIHLKIWISKFQIWFDFIF